MAANETRSEKVVVLTYKYYGKEGGNDIIEEVTCEDYKIVYAVPCEVDKGTKKVIGDMDEEAMNLEEGYKNVSRE